MNFEEIEETDVNNYLTNDSTSSNLLINNSELMCEKCDETFQTQDGLNVHRIRKHLNKNPVYCSICHSKFTTMDDLKRHIKLNHHNSNNNKIHQFQCIECNKSFKFPSSLAKHLLIHTNDKSFICNTCGKGFVHKAGLQVS